MLFTPYKNEPFSDFGDAAVSDELKAALSLVESRLGQEWPLVIGAQKVNSGEWLDSFDPGQSDRLVGRAAAGKAEHIDRAFDAAEAAYATWSAFSMEDRSRALMRLAALMRRNKHELSAWLIFEAG